MIRKEPLFLILFLTVVLSSCFKEEKMIPRHPRGNVQTDTLAMTDNYKNQLYFDLSSGKVVSQNLKTISDIGFDCRPGGWKVIVNSADFVQVADLGAVPFGVTYDTTGVKWRFDKSNGNPDSLAFGNWFEVTNGDTVSNGHLFAINRGMDENGNNLGLVQLSLDSLKHGIYYFRWAKLNGTNPVTASVSRNPAVNFTWYSFNQNGNPVNLEPPKEAWDLLFTQYTTLLFTDQGAAYPYLVTGVLLNRDNVAGVMDTIHSFEEINLDLVNSLILKPDLDVIGYDWKQYSFVTGTYAIMTNRKYIIRDAQGVYYKLRFVSFYSTSGATTGEKGFPVIEFQAL